MYTMYTFSYKISMTDRPGWMTSNGMEVEARCDGHKSNGGKRHHHKEMILTWRQKFYIFV